MKALAKDQFGADRKIGSCERNHIRTCTYSPDYKGSIIALSAFYRAGRQLKTANPTQQNILPGAACLVLSGPVPIPAAVPDKTDQPQSIPS